MTLRTASCCCGALSLRAEGEPLRISVCHCLECQKRTGSAFGVQARYRDEDISVSGTPSTYARKGDEGGTAVFRFCGTCGTTLYWQADALAGFTTVAVGAFADPAFPRPRVSVYGVRRHPWAVVEGIEERFD